MIEKLFNNLVFLFCIGAYIVIVGGLIVWSIVHAEHMIEKREEKAEL